MNTIKYKVLTVIAMAGLYTVSTQAQQKHEFSIYGGGGVSTLNYNLQNINQDELKAEAGGVVGVGYTYFFNQQWGITTGVELTTYKVKAKLYSLLDMNEAVDDYGDRFNFMVYQKGHEEKQEATYLNIPIMAQFQAKEGTGFYTALGGKIGIPLKGKYRYSTNSLKTVGYYPSLNASYDDVEYRGFGEFERVKGKGDVDFKVAFTLSAEAGMKWSLNESLRLYTGVYADYGLNDIIKGEKNKKILPYNDEDPSILINNSILNSEYSHDWSNNKSLVSKVKPLAVGLKIRMSFSIQ